MLTLLNMHIENSIDLKPYTTFGISAIAKRFARFQDIEGINRILDQRQDDSLLVLGGGSNILLTEAYNGLVIKNEIGGISLEKADEAFNYVRAGGGVNWHLFVMDCLAKGYTGLENLSLIPGTVGASPMQNNGAYGVELKDVFEELQALNLATREIVNFSKSDCNFGYRESIFKNSVKGEYLILSVLYKLPKIPVYNTSYGAIKQELEAMGVSDPDAKSISQAVINIRQSKLPDPKQIGNAGSFFKNPEVPEAYFLELKRQFPEIVGYAVGNEKVKLAAGWLIENCGWKGYREGDAGCHAKQALVLVNYGNAKGIEILNLANRIIDSVREKFGVSLNPEVNII